MGLAGFSWFAGSFWSAAQFLHRGPLVHLHASYPTGRLRWWPAVATVIIAYVASIAGNDWATLALSALLATVVTANYLRSSGTTRRAGRPALLAGWGFAAALGLAAVNHLAGWQADREVLWVYYAVVGAAVVTLLVDLVRARWANAVVTDLVIDLGGREGTGTLRGTIARALGDPTLILAYWLPNEQRFVDDSGRTVDVSEPGPGRAVTPLNDRGTPLGVLIHDATVLDDPELVGAVAEAARLAVTNAAMQAAARERVAALTASRERIVAAGDAEHRKLEGEIRSGVEQRLTSISEQVGELQRHADGLPAELLEELEQDLASARAELDQLAQGLRPSILTERGSTAAILALPFRSGARLDVVVSTGPLSPAAEATLYFVCAEALTNVAKHAEAQHTRIEVSEHDSVITATIDDDGTGGADPTRGSGLRGLRDRTEALGGELTIESRPGGGTRVRAVLPLPQPTTTLGDSMLAAPSTG